MQVVLTTINEDEVLKKLYTACRTCYNAGTPTDMWNDIQNEGAVDKEKMVKLLKHVLDSGHHSVLEHCQLTFLVSGVSRALTHQLVRHRVCSFSQQSQRYVEFKDGNFKYITPLKIRNNEEAKKVFEECMSHISKAYAKLAELGLPAEDARAVLPNACASNIVVSMNLRELMHVSHERTCTCAQAEIRKLVGLMNIEVIHKLPFMQPYLGPKCEVLGYCNESKSRSCGRKKTKGEVIGY